MRGTPITGSARGVSITDTVSRAQKILEDRPEPQGRDRYANRTNRPPRGGGKERPSGDAAARRDEPEADAQPSGDEPAAESRPVED